jgi:two-component system chemotaxis sensor kinase CheA
MSEEYSYNEQFVADLLDDLYAEFDEILASVRRDILSLEDFVDKDELDESLINALLRNFHTLKGLLGTVNLKTAEQLAHQMETYLRAVQNAKLSTEGVKALISAAQMLENSLVAYKEKTELPDITEISAQILSVTPEIEDKEKIEEKPEKPEKPEKAEPVNTIEKIWHFRFIPSSELAESGINVNTIRSRLEDIGELLEATPCTTDTGGLGFDFIVKTTASESEFKNWQNDGLTYKLEEQEKQEDLEELEELELKGTMRLWRFKFIPSPELIERNINVNNIHERLKKIGEVLEVMPSMTEEGKLAFNFIVVTPADESHFRNWTKDGIQFKLHENQNVAMPPVEDDEPVAKPVKPVKPVKPETSSRHHPVNMVRVDMTRLDELMRIIGDLVITRARQENNFVPIEPLVSNSQLRALQENSLIMERQLRDLREGIMRVRLVKIATVFEKMKFVVRELSGGLKKDIKLELSGQETEIDKLVVEKMSDPLLHLVRNAVSHAIESPEEREALGKPPEGTIRLQADTAGDAIIIVIEDDGRGIDIEEVAERARTKGLLGTEETLDDESQLLDILCTPGFTTREKADFVSGRGVGMDVVKNTVNELGGLISLKTEVGIGTRFSIQLPLTLAIADALIISVGEQKFAIPRISVREIFKIEDKKVTVLENNELINHQGSVLPLVNLSQVFGLQTNIKKSETHVLVVGGETSIVGIVVDRIIGEREIVVRAINDPLVRVDGIAGASELGDGRVILILDVAGLSRLARRMNNRN